MKQSEEEDKKNAGAHKIVSQVKTFYTKPYNLSSIPFYVTIDLQIDKDLLSPDREVITDQITHNTKAPLGDPTGFMGFIYMKVEELLTGTKLSQTTGSTKPILPQVPAHQKWKHAAYCTICRKFNMLEGVLFCFFQAVRIVSDSSRWLVLLKSLLCSLVGQRETHNILSYS